MDYPLNLLFDRLSYLQSCKLYSGPAGVLQEFLWSIFLMDDLKSDSMLLGMLQVPKKGYQHVFY